MLKRLVPILLVLCLIGCTKKPVETAVPGSINTLDAWAYRIVADSSASVHSVKTWEQCSVANFPATIDVDGATEPCDSKAGTFPMQYKGDLNTAIISLNTASALGKAYHAGGANDPQALISAVNQLSAAISAMLTHLGGTK